MQEVFSIRPHFYEYRDGHFSMCKILCFLFAYIRWLFAWLDSLFSYYKMFSLCETAFFLCKLVRYCAKQFFIVSMRH